VVNKKRYINVFSVFLLFLLLGAVVPRLYAQDVAVILSEDYKVYSLALTGFKSVCNASVREYSMYGMVEEGERIIKNIESQDPKLIFAIGNKAAQVAKMNIFDVPIVFSLVINPEQYGLTGGNICGVSLDVSPQDQLKMLKEVAPSARKVGVIYNPAKNENIVYDAKSVARNLGLEIIAKKAITRADVSEAIDDLSGRIDAFWMIIDPLVANRAVLKRLLLFTLTERVALMVPAEAFVKEGGLLAADVDYLSIGRQAGEIANQILVSAGTPRSIGVKTPSDVGLVVNLKTARTIGLSIPQSIIDEAAKVIE